MPLSKFFFFATAAVTTIFVITILAMIIAMTEEPQAPVNITFNKYGAIVLTVEVLGIGLLGMAAMIADRRETLQKAAETRDNQKASTHEVS